MKLFDLFERLNRKKIISGGILFIIFINTIAFPFFPKLFSYNSSATLEILDLQFGFDKTKVLEILQNLGRQGREIYLYSTLWIDTPYALIYGFIYALIFYSLLQAIGKIHWFRYIFFFPFLISIFDLLENFSTIIFIKKFPEIPENLVFWASGFNQLKWIFALFTLGIFILLIFLWLREKMKNQKYF